jgi:hypothetical protein
MVVRLRQSEQGRAARSVSDSVAEAAVSPKSAEPAKTVAPVQKPVDVYFLSEAGAAADPKSHPKTMRQPVVNGNRRVGPPRAITSKTEGEFIAPRWSPDGLEVMFSTAGYNGLFTKGSSGGELAKVTGKDSVGFWAKYNDKGQIETRTNSGESQAFQSDGSPVDSARMMEDTSLVGTFTKDDTVYYRANPGEAAKPISQGDDRFYGGVVSPDGKYVAYNGLHTGLYVAPLDGSAPPVNLGEGYSPSWLPDGSGVVYNISQDDGHRLIGSDLYMATVDGGTVSNLTQSPYDVETNPSVSPDGTKVAFEKDGVIYIADLQ